MGYAVQISLFEQNLFKRLSCNSPLLKCMWQY